jgi:uncharacterized RDD family membrane protein YckC
MSASPVRESVTTPEGVTLHFQTASVSERAVALAIDLVLMLLIVVACAFTLGFVFGSGLLMLVVFAVRQFWFVFFETRWNGSTPGKSRFRLRVIRADGGPLTTEILLARNLSREAELFVPLTMLLAPQLVFGDQSGITQLVASIWILLLLLFPLTNRHRLRVGDLLAGTRVVVAPRAALLEDQADSGPAVEGSRAERPVEFAFTPAQLSIYGLSELEVLQDVLHKARGGRPDDTVIAVCKSICKRIGWTDLAAIGGRQREFLLAFYAAQRAHLEQHLLLGKRRERKAPPR